VLAVAAVVGFTVFGVWLLRPGGLAHRQPRATWLVAGGLVAAVVIVVMAVRPDPPPRRHVWVPSGLAAVAIVCLAVWFLWPGGIVEDDDSPEPIAELEDVLPDEVTDTAPTTGAPSDTTGAPASGPEATGG
jgi:hypothetical protein